MKYTRLKLVNFIGINNGMGKDSIEIFFPDNGNIITSIVGENGSGKSTILSMLSPFKGSFDSRKNLIIPGKEGIKEIDIENNGHIYKIKHVYGKTASSFISEDGVELNENGGVRTFEDIVAQKFKKLNSDYMKIAKIGSNVANFIQFTTAQRKAYISSCVDSVTKYTDAYDVVSKKAKVNEQQIKQIASDLKQYGNVEDIENKIKENEDSLKIVDDNIIQMTGMIATVSAEITSLNSSLVGVNYVGNKAIIAEKEKTLRHNKQINELFNVRYSDITNDNIDDKINELATELTSKTKDLDKIKEDITRERTTYNSLTYDKIKIESHVTEKSNISIDELQNEINTKDAQIAKYNKDFSDGLAKLLLDNQSKISSYTSSFKNFMLILDQNYALLNNNTIDPSKKNVELFFGPDFSSVFANYAAIINRSNTNNQELYENKKLELAQKNTNVGQLDILSKRPSDCKIDTCPFIANALQYKNLPEEIKSLESIIATLNKNIAETESQIDAMNDLKVNYAQIARLYKAMLPKENIVYRYFISLYGKLTSILQQPLTTFVEEYNKVINDVESIQNDIIDYNDITADVALKKVQLTQTINNEKTRLYFDNELMEIKKKLNDYNNEISRLTLSQTQLETVVNDLTNKLTDYKSYKVSLSETADLENDIASLTTINVSFEENSKEKENKSRLKTEYEEKLEQYRKDKKVIETNITNFKVSETTVNNLKSNLDIINANYDDIVTVKSALNPKSGIPLIFIQSYLNGTEAIANELLKIAYEGKFEIKFVPTATDFFIQVRCKDNVIDDITNASQGEIAMTTISISLALIERSMGDCNVLCLDEIDSTLDTKNRESFINILNKQIEKLGIEQVFIISHNNAFDNCNMNLIVLPGAYVNINDEDFMKNKEVIFNYNNGGDE